jgi:inner membrane protein
LQLMDYSLLFGNIGLVIVLALVMYFSRKIDWYAMVKSSNSPD